MNTRLIASRIIDNVTNGRSLSDCLAKELPALKAPRDAAFVQAITYGICRFYTRLDVIVSELLQKPMKAKDSDVHALLLVGLYQLIYMRVPPHAAVTETVNATEKLNKSWARGFVNAILREYLRSVEKLAPKLSSDPEAHYAHPGWWINKIKKHWPAQWEAILAANNEHPPLSLRVNRTKISRDAYLAKLKESDIDATIIPETKQGIVLAEGRDVESLPGFAEGEVSVQDGAAQLATELLEVASNQTILDACAAPGGKLTHILELATNATVTAVEKEATRIDSIKENLKRLSISAKVVCADAANIDAWWNGELFDRILLDAPCSASGVIRRHPDIKLLREPEDVTDLAKEQMNLLDALWPLLKPEGLLLYTTCSIFPAENSQVIEAFLASHTDAKEDKVTVPWGVPCAIGQQILPGSINLDGFYYARIKKLVE